LLHQLKVQLILVSKLLIYDYHILIRLATIPGRPPTLRSISSHMCLSQHKRSQSLSPESEFLPIAKNHIASLLLSSPQRQAPQLPESPILSPISTWPLPNTAPTWSIYSSTYNPTRPLSPILSPILSPVEGTTPVQSPITATFSPTTPVRQQLFPSPSSVSKTLPPPPRNVGSNFLYFKNANQS